MENLKSALQKLEQKLAEAQAKKDLLIARHRRARGGEGQRCGVRHYGPIRRSDLRPHARSCTIKCGIARPSAKLKVELVKDDVEAQLPALEKQDQIDKMLAEMKAKRGAGPHS